MAASYIDSIRSTVTATSLTSYPLSARLDCFTVAMFCCDACHLDTRLQTVFPRIEVLAMETVAHEGDAASLAASVL